MKFIFQQTLWKLAQLSTLSCGGLTLLIRKIHFKSFNLSLIKILWCCEDEKSFSCFELFLNLKNMEQRKNLHTFSTISTHEILYGFGKSMARQETESRSVQWKNLVTNIESAGEKCLSWRKRGQRSENFEINFSCSIKFNVGWDKNVYLFWMRIYDVT